MAVPSLNVQRQAAEKFVQKWLAAEGYEKGEDSIFWTELLRDVYGVTDVSQFVKFQKPVELERGANGKKTRWGYRYLYSFNQGIDRTEKRHPKTGCEKRAV